MSNEGMPTSPTIEFKSEVLDPTRVRVSLTCGMTIYNRQGIKEELVPFFNVAASPTGKIHFDKAYSVPLKKDSTRIFQFKGDVEYTVTPSKGTGPFAIDSEEVIGKISFYNPFTDKTEVIDNSSFTSSERSAFRGAGYWFENRYGSFPQADESSDFVRMLASCQINTTVIF